MERAKATRRRNYNRIPFTMGTFKIANLFVRGFIKTSMLPEHPKVVKIDNQVL